ncbi:29205_t:CDS:2, partial [Racocetra persica]
SGFYHWLGNVLQTDNIALYLAYHFKKLDQVSNIGTENMNKSFYTLLADPRWEVRFGLDLKLEDSLAVCLVDQYFTRTPIGVTAKNLAQKITLLINKLMTEAAGCFFNKITPVEVKTKKGPVLFSRDEHPRTQTTIQTLSKQPSVFVKDTSVVTVGNASGISDSTGAIIVASKDAIKEHEIVPLACIVSYSVTGVEPTIIGIGPVPAIKEALKRANLKLSDIGLVEINEVFAPQYLSVKKKLGFDYNITNANSDLSNLFTS